MCRSVFIIDDYPINLQIAELFIKRQGFFDKISSYLNAQEAFDYLMTHIHNPVLLPDVILLDIHMPILDGWMFLDRFEDIQPYLKKNIDVFIVSSSADYYDRQRIKRYPSVKGYFPKPITDDILQNIVNLRLASTG